MTPLLCLIALGNEFGSTPVQAEFEEGQKIYKRKKGIDRTEKDNRVVIGQWFDGERNQVVEEAIFLTPGLLSRWLGYQSAAGTPKSDIDKSWTQCTAQFNGKTVTLVRLARLGTVDPHDGDVENTADFEAIDNVTIQIRQTGQEWQEVKYRTVQDLQDRNPQDVLKDTWDQVLAKFSAWPSTPTTYNLISEIRWGRNRRISLIADTPSLDAGSKCEMRIVEKDRTRVIKFNYPKS